MSILRINKLVGKMLFGLLFAVIASLHSLSVLGQSYEMNSDCLKAYDEVVRMRFGLAAEIIEEQKLSNAENLMPLLIEDYIDFFTAFINEDEREFNGLLERRDERLASLENGNRESPFYLYAKAEVYLHWAMARIKFDQYFKAFWEIRKAYKLLEENNRKFPDFYPNKKSLGILHALVGTVPDQYKWGIKILGLDGDILTGLGEIEEFLEQSKSKEGWFYDEAMPIYAFLLVYLKNDKKTAWDLINELDTKDHLLNTFIVSDIAFRTGHSDFAIDILEKRTVGPDFFEFHLLDYLLGVLKLNKGDSASIQYLNMFVNNFKGRHYLKDAYQKIAWYYLLQEDYDAYEENIMKCITEGRASMDLDKQAKKNALSGLRPNPQLLRARLLFDGGYYSDAIEVLKFMDESSLTENKHKVEFLYRFARVNEGLGKEQEAVKYYSATIDMGRDTEYYYGPKAALELGNMYERKGEFENARYYYRLCFDFSGYEYENSIEQQAKAGLNRLNDVE